VTEFMPVAGGRPTDRHRLVRLLRTVRGTMRFVAEVKPRFDYGRAAHKLEISDDGAIFSSDGMDLTLNPVGERTVSLGEQGLGVERHGEDLRLTRTLREGESGGEVVLESMGGPPRRILPADPPGGTRPADRGDREVLAGLGGAVDLPGPLAGDCVPLGHQAQADDLRAHRGAGGRAHRRAARADRGERMSHRSIR